MDVRTRSETVTFRHPFKLSVADDVQPAGRYVVETDEELLQTSSLTAYRRISTFIRLPGRSGSMELARIIDIDPAELSSALARDDLVQETAPLPAHHKSIAVQGRKRRTMGFVKNGWRRWLGLDPCVLTWTAWLVGGGALTGLLAWSIGGD